MEFSGELFPTSWLWLFGALYAWSLSRALRWADWQRLGDTDQLHVFLGAIVCLLVLSTLRTEMVPPSMAQRRRTVASPRHVPRGSISCAAACR